MNKKYKYYFYSIKNRITQIIFRNNFSIQDQVFFIKRLSFLIKSGMPMLESMHVILKQTKSKAKIKIFNKVLADLANGQSLATSLENFPKIFGKFSINIIRAGELSGTLTENLSYLAVELKKKEMLHKKIISAMLYPIIVAVATLGITVFLVMYIFPKIIPIFTGLKAKLPFSTKVVIYTSNLIRHDGIWIFFILLLAIIITNTIIKRSEKAKFIYDDIVLRIPFSGKISKYYNLTNSCRTLGLLIKSGISLTESLMITSNTTNNSQYKKAFIDMANHVTEGKNISLLLDKLPSLFPVIVGHMVAVGEKSGNLSNTLIYLSEFYENEFEDVAKNLSSAIEPALMVTMGILVGFIAISIITPIYSITQNLHT